MVCLSKLDITSSTLLIGIAAYASPITHAESLVSPAFIRTDKLLFLSLGYVLSSNKGSSLIKENSITIYLCFWIRSVSSEVRPHRPGPSGKDSFVNL